MGVSKGRIEIADPLVVGSEKDAPDLGIVRGQCPYCQFGDRIVFRRYRIIRKNVMEMNKKPCLCINCAAEFPLWKLTVL